jgi:gliding motility-associated lipoprotein GldH
MQKFLFFFFISFVFVSCNTLDVFEKTVPFTKHEWKSGDAPSFTFDISDTTALYNMYAVIRHEDNYRYQNIWLTIQVKTPDTTYTIKQEFPLTNNNKWAGTAMDDIIEHRMPLNAAPIGLKKGTYTFTLQQIMREDPLPHVLNAGIRVEKAH